MADSETMERPKTKAKVRYVRMSASKVRLVLNLIRGKNVAEAFQVLELTERLAAQTVSKCLKSAVANAEHNDGISPEELYVSACFADEGSTLKRFRPVGRGRASKILKQTCHVTVEVSRLTEEELDSLRAKSASSSTKPTASASRSKRVAKSKKAQKEEITSSDEDSDVVEDNDAVDAVEEDLVEDSVEEESTTESNTDEETK